MKRTIALMCLFACSALPVRAQTRTVDLGKAAIGLAAAGQRFNQYNQDFVNFAKDRVGNPDAVSEIVDVAGVAFDNVHSCGTLLELYTTVQSKSDQDAIRPIIEKDILYYAIEDHELLKLVDLYVGYTNDSKVAAEASQMRTDLDDLSVALAAIANTLKASDAR